MGDECKPTINRPNIVIWAGGLLLQPAWLGRQQQLGGVIFYSSTIGCKIIDPFKMVGV